MHRGCFVWTPTPPLSGRRTPGSRACVRVRAFLARSGGPASWARSGAPHLSSGCSWCALYLFGPLRAGVAPFVVVVGFLFFSFFLSLSRPLVAPLLCPALRVFRPQVPWALASCPPPFFLFCPPPRIVSPLSPALRVFQPRVPSALASCPPPSPPLPPPLLSLAFPASRLPWASAPPPFFFAGCAVLGVFVCLRPSGVPACASVVLSLSLLCVPWLVLCGVGCWAWLSSAVSWWVLVSCFGGAVLVWPRGSPPCGSAWCVLVFRCPVLCSVALCCRVVVCCCAVPFVCVVACACCLFLAAARLLCVFRGVVLCVPCPLRPVRCCAALRWCPFVVLCASSVLFLVAGVVGSCCRCLLLRVCWWLWMPGVVVWWCVSALMPVSGLAIARRLPVVSCSPVLCPVALCCRVVLCCGALSSFFVFLLAAGAGFPLFPVGSGLRAGSGSFLCLCPACTVLCWCACAVALCSVLSCPRGAGWCFLLLPVMFVCLLLGLAVLCCLLVGPGGSWCRVSVLSCGVSLGAVLRRVAARCAAWRCVVVRCAVSFCSVWCCRALCCVLGRCPSSWGPVPPGAVFCLVPLRCVFCCGVSLRGVVCRCALCRARPGVSCCAFPVVSALCSVAVWPALPRCPAPLCCAPWCCAAAWCRGVLSCRLVRFVSCVGVVVPTCKTAAKFRKIFFFLLFFGF